MRPTEDRYPSQKSVAVVGGIMALQPQYRRVLEENNLCPKIYNQDSTGIRRKVEGADVIILFAGTVSHRMAIKARKTANSFGIPLVTVTRSSISALKKSISSLPVITEQGQAKGAACVKSIKSNPCQYRTNVKEQSRLRNRRMQNG